MASLIDYLPKDAVFVLPATLDAQAEAFTSEVIERYEQRRFNVDRPLLKPELLFLCADELKQKTSAFAQIALYGRPQQETSGKCVAFDCATLNDKNMSNVDRFQKK